MLPYGFSCKVSFFRFAFKNKPCKIPGKIKQFDQVLHLTSDGILVDLLAEVVLVEDDMLLSILAMRHRRPLNQTLV